MTENATVFLRQEKLDAARKKLKNFQQSHRTSNGDDVYINSHNFVRPSSATFSISSIDSFAESTRSADYRHVNQNALLDRIQFCHDENLSPFQRVGKSLSNPNSQVIDGRHSRVSSAENNDGDLTPPSTLAHVKQPNSDTNANTQRVEVNNMAYVPDDSENANLSNNIFHNRIMNVENRLPDLPESVVLNQMDDLPEMDLKRENDYLRTYCSQIYDQFNLLNTNYAQLSDAYQILSHKSAVSEAGLIPDTCQATTQDRQTISVLVEEKSDLQSQLRQAMGMVNEKNLAHDELQGRLKISRQRLTELECESDRLRVGNKAMEASFERQTAELTRLRAENAQLQAKLSESVQDRSEAQVKYKQRCKDFDALLKEAELLRNRLSMQDIYLQQITGSESSSVHDTLSKHDLDRISSENQQLKADLGESRQQIDRIASEIYQTNEQHDFYCRQLNTKIAELVSTNEALVQENKTLFQDVDRLKMANEQWAAQQQQQATVVPAVDVVEKFYHDTFVQEMSDKLAILQQAYDKSTQELQLANKNMADQKAYFESRVQQLESFIDSMQSVDSNAKSLLEQLHNEKAASSRCVSQNLTLKNQLVELENKFVSVTNDQMESATKLQTAEHNVKVLEDKLQEKTTELNDLRFKHDEECRSLKAQVNAVLRQEFDTRQLHDRLHHFQATAHVTQEELARLRNTVEALQAENAALSERMVSAPAVQENRVSNSHTVESGMQEGTTLQSCNEERASIEQLRNELHQTTQQMRQVSTENAELRHIMEQNAADENHNTIHVELSRAVERLGSLSNENERLRRRLAQVHQGSEQGATSASPDVPPGQFNGASAEAPAVVADDRVSVCSEHVEMHRDAVSAEAFANLKTAMDQLQERFKQTMDRNADLTEQNEQLEHLIVKLQGETETIGEYVTLYRHQRQIIRDKLKEKEEHVAKLSRENACFQEKLTELQDLIIKLMKERGVLTAYPPHVMLNHAKPSRAPPSKTPPRPKTLSETVVDETADVSSPTSRSLSPMSEPGYALQESSLDSSHIDQINQKLPETTANETDVIATMSEDRTSNQNRESGTVEQILQLLHQLQKYDLSSSTDSGFYASSEKNLHCKYCTGRMITL